MSIKKLSAICFLFFFLFPVFALNSEESGRSAAMGGISSAGSDSDINFFYNPASIYFYNQRKKFMVKASFADSHSTENAYFIENPDSCLSGQFTGKGVALGLDLDSGTMSPFSVEPDGSRTYSVLRRFDLKFALAYGYKDFSVGVGVTGGSDSRKSDIDVGKDSFVGDFIRNSFLTEYDRVPDSEFVDFKVGAMYKIGAVTFAVQSNKLLSYSGKEKDDLSFENALDSMSYGVYFSQDRYAKRGRLKKWVISAGAEARNFPDEKSDTLHFGTEVMYQLAREYHVAFRTGYYGKTDDMGDGVLTFGLGSRLNKFDIGANFKIPVKCFDDEPGAWQLGIDLIYLI